MQRILAVAATAAFASAQGVDAPLMGNMILNAPAGMVVNAPLAGGVEGTHSVVGAPLVGGRVASCVCSLSCRSTGCAGCCAG